MNSSSIAPCTNEEQGQVEIWDSTYAFVKPMVMKAAILLGIPDLIARKGPLTLEEIALETSSKNKDLLFRILRFLAYHDIFSEESVDPGTGQVFQKYGLTRSSEWLVSKENSFAPYPLLHLNKSAQAAWHNLHECVLEKDGRKLNPFTRANGMTIYDFTRQNPWFNDLFNGAMAAGTSTWINTVVKYKDVFLGVNTLVDVGGGLGLVISKIVEAFPHIKGINFDLPTVIAKAPTLHGVEHIAGDMYTAIPTADAILLKTILHGYDNETCMKILGVCYNTLPNNGKLIIIDFILDEASPISYASDMLMAAISTSGRERTESEWQTMLISTGFTVTNVHRMLMSMCIMEAFKL